MNKYQKAIEIVKNNGLYWDFTWLFTCVCSQAPYERYAVGCVETKDINFATKEEYNLFKNVLVDEKTKVNRKYVAYFKKYYLYQDGRKYQDNAHFCISSLETDAIKRPFENDNIVVEELKVIERLTGKVIYQGTSYEEYLKVIRGLDNE